MVAILMYLFQENSKYLKSITDSSLIVCDKILNDTNNVSTNLTNTIPANMTNSISTNITSTVNKIR